MLENSQAGSPPPTPAGASARLADRSIDYLRSLLLDGGLDPGDSIPIDAIARKLGVSRQPVVQAVRRLSEEGFVAIRPQAGSWVVAPRASEVADFYGLFAPAEAFIARLAAGRRDDHEADAFKRLVAEIEHAAKAAGSPRAHDASYRALNRRFHNAVHVLAQSPDVARTVSAMWDRSDFYIRVAFGSLYFDAQTHDAHRAIAIAIQARDLERAYETTARHIARVGERVVEQLAERNRLDERAL